MSDIADLVKAGWYYLSSDQQQVSDIADFMKGSLITSFPITNSKWVKLQILSKGVLSCLFLCQIGSEWHYIYCEGILITSFLWPTGSERHCILCGGRWPHIFSYDQQFVSDITHFVKYSLHCIFSNDQQEVSNIAHLVKVSQITFFCDQQEVSKIVHFVEGHLITLVLWPTAGGWHCTLWKAVWSIFSYDQ